MSTQQSGNTFCLPSRRVQFYGEKSSTLWQNLTLRRNPVLRTVVVIVPVPGTPSETQGLSQRQRVGGGN
jgi:hypothetical protein